MNRIHALVTWAVVATALLAVTLIRPDAPGAASRWIRRATLTPAAHAQTPDSPARLEWYSWMFYRLTSPAGKVILFSPWLREGGNRESPLTLDDIDTATVILVPGGHGDDMGNAIEIHRKLGTPIVTAFELANWMVSRGADPNKLLRAQPGSRFEVDGIKIQVVNSVHGSGAFAGPGPAVYGGPALGFIVTLENGVKVYHSMSSALTQDMQLYGRLYKPHVALLGIGSGMYPEEAAIAAEYLMTDNPNLHSVFPTHHNSTFPAERQGPAFVKAVQGHRYRRDLTAFDPKPGQGFLVNATGTRAR
jgi:L-ascorbate metabolism protein UlaG (beta-lactamase superfamily)